MNSFLTDLRTPSWWLSVVIAGLMINVLSSYIRNALDISWKHLVLRVSTRSAARKKNFEETVSMLAHSQMSRIQYQIHGVSFRLKGYDQFLSGAFAAFVGGLLTIDRRWIGVPLLAGGGYLIIGGVMNVGRATFCDHVVAAAENLSDARREAGERP